LRWLKTEHAYPNRAALTTERRSLGDILVNEGYVTREELDSALSSQPANLRLEEFLVQRGKLSEEQLCAALGLQHDLPTGKPHADIISAEVTRAIPADLARRHKVLPFRIVAGQLYIATQEVPTEQMMSEVKAFWPFEMRFHLVHPRAFKELIEGYLPPLPSTSVPGFLTGLGLLASLVAIARTIFGTSNKLSNVGRVP
jgi:hypothetical protein